MTLEELETHFNQLTEITDQVALITSVYDSDVLGDALTDMENFVKDVMSWNMEEMDAQIKKAYLSHLSFHREIVAEIIAETRQSLKEGQTHVQDRRPYLKRLVHYHKNFIKWFAQEEKKAYSKVAHSD